MCAFVAIPRCRRKGQLEISDTNIRPSARSSDLTALSPSGLGNPASLQETDVRASLKLLQQFMVSVVTADEISESCTHLVTLAKQYEALDPNKDPAAELGGKAGAPSTTDKKETIDDKKDNSVTFLILDTMVQLLNAVMGLDGAAAVIARRQDLFRIDQRVTTTTTPAPVQSSLTATMLGPVVSAETRSGAIAKCGPLVPFAFNYLTHIYSSAVRHAACRLLGTLSVSFLPNITSLLVEKMTAAKKDQAKREFASFQRCVSFLDFRVGTPQQVQHNHTHTMERRKFPRLSVQLASPCFASPLPVLCCQVKVTVEYLTSLLAEMKNVDRGVLRQEMCQSIDSIYTKILAPVDPRRDAEWQSFVRSEKGKEDWDVLFDRIYTQIAKWSSKSKHMVFCFETLAHMVVFSRNIGFFVNKKVR